MPAANPMIEEFKRELATKRSRAKSAYAAFDKLRTDGAKKGANLLKDRAAFKELDEACKVYDDAADAVQSAESTMARMAQVMCDPSYTPSSGGGPDITGFVRDLTQWTKALGDSAAGAARFPSSPGFMLIEKGQVRAALMTTLSYPSQSFRRPGIVELPSSPPTILDVLPIVPVDSDLVEIPREKTFTNTAVETAEGEPAGEGEIEYEVEPIACKWIPFTLPATKQVLSDEGRLRVFVEDRLLRGVRERLQTQVIKGDGLVNNLTGIMEWPDILTQDAGSNTKADLVELAKTKVLVATRGRYVPQTLLIHPTDHGRLVRQKEGAEGAYILGGPGRDGRIWGLQPVVSVDIDEGSPVVCDVTGAELYVRSDVAVNVSDSHNGQFTQGIVQFLASGRFGFALLEPKAFVILTDFDS